MSKTTNKSVSYVSKRSLLGALTFAGNTITLIGCLGILLGLVGLINLNDFAIGITSGIRVIGTVAITGCLVSAIGYGFLEYSDFS
jgi:hypothetical protein